MSVRAQPGSRAVQAPRSADSAADPAPLAGAGTHEIRLRRDRSPGRSRAPWYRSLVGWLIAGVVVSGAVAWFSLPSTGTRASVIEVETAPPGFAVTVSRVDDVLARVLSGPADRYPAVPRGGFDVPFPGGTTRVGEAVYRAPGGSGLVRIELRRLEALSRPGCPEAGQAAATRCQVRADGAVVRWSSSAGTSNGRPASTWVRISYPDGGEVFVRAYAGPAPEGPATRSRPPLGLRDLKAVAASPQWR